jgi:hypothetical protein
MPRPIPAIADWVLWERYSLAQTDLALKVIEKPHLRLHTGQSA